MYKPERKPKHSVRVNPYNKPKKKEDPSAMEDITEPTVITPTVPVIFRQFAIGAPETVLAVSTSDVESQPPIMLSDALRQKKADHRRNAWELDAQLDYLSVSKDPAESKQKEEDSIASTENTPIVPAVSSAPRTVRIKPASSRSFFPSALSAAPVEQTVAASVTSTATPSLEKAPAESKQKTGDSKALKT